MKMRHEAYIELNDEFVKRYYSEEDYKRYKGYRLLAIDGSKIQLPSKEEVIEKFGLAENREKTIPMAMCSTVYDVLNKIAINAYFDRYKSDERRIVDKHLNKLKELLHGVKDILIMDRGYPSLPLITTILASGYEFVMRCNGMNFIREIKNFALNNGTDVLIEVELTSKRRRKILIRRYVNSPEKITLRVVKIELSNGVTEYLITSLRDKSMFTQEDLKEIYHYRWGEETYFNFLKNVLEIENFSGRTPETIRQDLYARILTSNICSLMMEEAQEELNQKIKMNDNFKYLEYKINKTVSMGHMKDTIIEMLLAPEEQWRIIYNNFVATIKRFYIPIVDNRHFNRKPKTHNKAHLKKRKVI